MFRDNVDPPLADKEMIEVVQTNGKAKDQSKEKILANNARVEIPDEAFPLNSFALGARGGIAIKLAPHPNSSQYLKITDQRPATRQALEGYQKRLATAKDPELAKMAREQGLNLELGIDAARAELMEAIRDNASVSIRFGQWKSETNRRERDVYILHPPDNNSPARKLFSVLCLDGPNGDNEESHLYQESRVPFQRRIYTEEDQIFFLIAQVTDRTAHTLRLSFRVQTEDQMKVSDYVIGDGVSVQTRQYLQIDYESPDNSNTLSDINPEGAGKLTELGDRLREEAETEEETAKAPTA